VVNRECLRSRLTESSARGLATSTTSSASHSAFRGSRRRPLIFPNQISRSGIERLHGSSPNVDVHHAFIDGGYRLRCARTKATRPCQGKLVHVLFVHLS